MSGDVKPTLTVSVRVFWTAVMLSVQEIALLLMAAVSLRDKLLIGLLYALGARVSEMVRLRYRDLDFDRACVIIWQGKGRTDRQVTLPASFEPLLRGLAKTDRPQGFAIRCEYLVACGGRESNNTSR